MNVIKIISIIIKVIMFILSMYFSLRFSYDMLKCVNLDYKKEAEKRKYYFKDFVKYFIIEVVYAFTVNKLVYTKIDYMKYGDLFLIVSFLYVSIAFLFWYFIIYRELFSRESQMGNIKKVILSVIYYIVIVIGLYLVREFYFI